MCVRGVKYCGTGSVFCPEIGCFLTEVSTCCLCLDWQAAQCCYKLLWSYRAGANDFISPLHTFQEGLLQTSFNLVSWAGHPLDTGEYRVCTLAVFLLNVIQEESSLHAPGPLHRVGQGTFSGNWQDTCFRSALLNQCKKLSQGWLAVWGI